MSTLSESRIATTSDACLAKPMKRCNKPLMEKRRRERINASLNQLKTLVLDALKKDTSQYSKLEKADILEMTVRHLKNIQRQHISVAANTDATVIGKYRAGFAECAGEVTRYLCSVEGLNADVHQRLLHHLSSFTSRVCNNNVPVGHVQQQAPMSTNAYVNPPPSHMTSAPVATMTSSLPGTTIPVMVAAPQQVAMTSSRADNTQTKQFFGTFQVIPASVLTTNQQIMIPVSSPKSPASATASSPSPSYTSPSPSPPVSPSSFSSSYTSCQSPTHVSSSYPSKHIAINKAIPHIRISNMDVMHGTAKDSLRDERVWRPW